MSQPSRIFALIVAAGTGSRAGGAVPKQYQPIGGKPLLRYSAEALCARPAIRGVQVVIHPEHQAAYEAASKGLRLLPPVIGGAERADSVRAGLHALAEHAPDFVMIHDAARPFLTQAMIAALIIALSPDEAVLPALSVADTVRRFEGGTWHEVSRKSLMRMQTPQCFPYDALVRLMGVSPPNLLPTGSLTLRNPEAVTEKSPTDEAALWLAAGKSLRYVDGDEDLRKVTTHADIAWAEDRVRSNARTVVGMGYDVHALMPAGDAGVIRLGGIDIANAHKLHGHSDADVVLHAVVDALLGSIAAGDIGSHFPPTDAHWKGANSAIFVEEACAQIAARGGKIQHVDVTIIGEQPKVSPHRDAMRAAIATLLQLPLSHVSVKATTTEKLGFTGREEGIACHAIATVSLPAEAA